MNMFSYLRIALCISDTTMNLYHCELIIKLMDVMASQTEGAAASSPYAFNLVATALCALVEDQNLAQKEKLRLGLGVTELPDTASPFDCFPEVGTGKFEFAGCVLGTKQESDSSKYFPLVYKKQMFCGPMSDAKLAQTFVKEQVGIDLETPTGDFSYTCVQKMMAVWQNDKVARLKEDMIFNGNPVAGVGFPEGGYMALHAKHSKFATGIKLPMSNDLWAVYIVPTEKCDDATIVNKFVNNPNAWKEQEFGGVMIPVVSEVDSEINLVDSLKLSGLQTREGALSVCKTTTRLSIDERGVRAESKMEIRITRGSSFFRVDSHYWCFVVDGDTGQVLYVYRSGNYGVSKRANLATTPAQAPAEAPADKQLGGYRMLGSGNYGVSKQANLATTPAEAPADKQLGNYKMLVTVKTYDPVPEHKKEEMNYDDIDPISTDPRLVDGVQTCMNEVFVDGVQTCINEVFVVSPGKIIDVLIQNKNQERSITFRPEYWLGNDNQTDESCKLTTLQTIAPYKLPFPINMDPEEDDNEWVIGVRDAFKLTLTFKVQDSE